MKTKWIQRDPEWIKLNPGKGTMYRAHEDGTPVKQVEAIEPYIYCKKFLPSEPVLNSRLKTAAPNAGIYVVKCEIEKHVYVGQSINMDNRMRNHKLYILSLEHSKSDKMYFLMREHCAMHGPDAFEFIKHCSLPNANEAELRKREAQVMSEFSGMGYTLYNQSLPKDATLFGVACGIYTDDIKKLVKALLDGSVHIDSVMALISVQGAGT